MYHRPRMCRTCLQMSRGDFKFVSLDSVDPLWESNSPNLKEQLIYLVPEMKIDSSGAYICTSCFIALRTAYEFKRMCQATEQKFQNHNYKYRRPYGVGPGSSQFHVALNENGSTIPEIANFRCQNLNYLQADTSIDITEHHLYDATKVAPRKQLIYINNVTQKLPEIDLEVVSNDKNANNVKNNTDKVENAKEVENKDVNAENTGEAKVEQKDDIKAENKDPKEQIKEDVKVEEEKEEAVKSDPDKNVDGVAEKKLDSVELRKKYNIGSQISILKRRPKATTSRQAIIKMACEAIPFLKSNGIGADRLRCHVRIQLLTSDFIKDNACSKYTLDELQEVANTYYSEDFEDLPICKFCDKCFSTNYWLQVHEEEHATDKQFSCTHCNIQFLRNDSLEEHMKIHNKLSLLTPASCDDSLPQIAKPPDPDAVPSSDSIKEEKPLNSIKSDGNLEAQIKKEEITVDDQGKSVIEPATTETATSEDNKAVTTDSVPKLQEDIAKASEDTEMLNVSTTIITPKHEEDLKPNTSKTVKYKKKYQNVVRYCRCLICSKMCRGEIQLYQHCRFVHVPNVTSSNYWSNIISVMRTTRTTLENIEDNETKEEVEEEEEEEEESLLIQTRSVNFRNVVNPYKCNICGKSFAEENFLNIHMYVHTPTILSPDNVFTSNYESPEVHTCYLCNKSFAKERYLKLHNLHVHLSKTTVCKICRREFKSDFWFSKHRCQQPVEVPVMDDSTKSFPCNFCNRRFARLRFMKSHRKRMHKNFIKTPIRIKPKYLPSRNNKEPFEMGDLEADVDPMQLYKISGTSSFDDDEDIIEIISDSDEYSDESSNESQGEEEEDETTDVYKGDGQYRRSFQAYNSNVVGKQETTETDLSNFINSSEITVRRKSVVRNTPKIQCDFCGEFIDESAYDNHIYEHNNMRLQKGLVARKAEHNYSFDPLNDGNSDNSKVVLKCHICFKAFKRKFYLISHVNRHLTGEDSQQTQNSTADEGEILHSEGEELDHYASENEAPQKELEDETDYGQVSIINGVEIWECCGKSFKLKAHFFRHFKIKHPRSVYKPKKPVIKTDVEPEPKPSVNSANQSMIELQEDGADTNRPLYMTQNSMSSHSSLNEAANDEQDESMDDGYITTQNISKHTILLSSAANKRKLMGLNETMSEDMIIKKPKIMKRELSDVDEAIRGKRIKTDIDEMLVRNNVLATPIHLSDVEFFPIGGRPSLKYECNVCDKKFKQKCQLRDHYNVHTGDKPYKCEFCMPVRGFTQTSSLYVHFRRVHAVIMRNCQWEVYSKNGSCLICSAVFEKHAFMFQHMKDHYVEKEFQCHVCMKQFSMTCHYIVHNIDPQEMQMILPQDNLEVVLTVEADDDDEEEEEDEKPKPLELKALQYVNDRSDTPASSVTEGTCDSDTSSINDGTEDGKSINPDHLKCEKCDKTFTDKQQLRFHKKSLAHIQQVQSIKKQSNVKEEEGGNAVVPNKSDTIEDIQNSVEAIMKKIRIIKRHHCSKCEMSFVKKVQLKKHTKRFHNRRPVAIKQSNVTPMEQLATPDKTQTSEDIKQPEVVPETTKGGELPAVTGETSTNVEPSQIAPETKETICEANTNDPDCETKKDESSRLTSDNAESLKSSPETKESTAKTNENLEFPEVLCEGEKAKETQYTLASAGNSESENTTLADDESQSQAESASKAGVDDIGSKSDLNASDTSTSDNSQEVKKLDALEEQSHQNITVQNDCAGLNNSSTETEHEDICNIDIKAQSDEQAAELDNKINSEATAERECEFSATSNNLLCSKDMVDADKPESPNPILEFTDPSHSSGIKPQIKETDDDKISSTIDSLFEPTVKCLENSSTSSNLQQNTVSSDYNLDCLQSSFGIDAESLEQAALATYAEADFTLDKIDMVDSSCSSVQNPKDSGLTEDSASIQPKSTSSDQHLDCPESIYSMDDESLKPEVSVSSADCNFEYPKCIIPNMSELETMNDAINDFDLSL